MHVAALYDIHGNLPALEAVIADVRAANVEMIVVGGDVLPGPLPRETLDCLLNLDLPLRFIRGNGDRVVLAQMRGMEPVEVPEQFREGIRSNAQQLTAEHENVLASWPASVRLEIAGLGDVLFCHATPRNDTDIFTRLTPEDRLVPIFQAAEAPLVVCGHTHMQFDRTISGIRVVNAGSVGMPYGQPGAYWLLLGPNLELRHTTYDLEKAAARIRATNYPSAEDFAANSILNPRSESQILEMLAKVEL
ncbi:MAG TPA: metallophosphoesterase family protein [Chthoniobacterales bacterium]|nr:metallophosphoesterase family protein [Chthoniobacterales bacterium]